MTSRQKNPSTQAKSGAKPAAAKGSGSATKTGSGKPAAKPAAKPAGPAVALSGKVTAILTPQFKSIPVASRQNMKAKERDVKFDKKLEILEKIVWKNFEVMKSLEEGLQSRREEVAEKILLHSKTYDSNMRPSLENVKKYEEEALENWTLARKELKDSYRSWRRRLAEILNDTSGDLANTAKLLRVNNEFTKLLKWDTMKSATISSTAWSDVLVKKDDIIKYGKKPIGEGAFGRVFKAYVYGNLVAVKELKQALPENVKDAAVLKTESQIKASSVLSLEEECKLLRAVKNDHILQFMGACLQASDNYYALITEIAHNGSLHDILYTNKNVKLSFGRKMTIVGEIVAGMTALHEEYKILHLDLKPANILLDDHYHAKIADFGLSHLNSEENYLRTCVGGTPYYMAPELFPTSNSDNFSSITLTDKADVYSFGILVNELVTETLPYSDTLSVSASFNEFVNLVRKQHPKIAPKCPTSLEQLLYSCWAYDYKVRPPFKKMSESKFWEDAKFSGGAAGDKQTKKLMKAFEEDQEIPFNTYLHQLVTKYHLESSVHINDSGDPIVRGLQHLLEVGNIGSNVEKSKVERLNDWLKDVYKKSEIPSVILSLFANSWFWGIYSKDKAETDLSTTTNNHEGNYLVRWDNVENLWIISRVVRSESSKKQKDKTKQILHTPVQNAETISLLVSAVQGNKDLKKPAENRPSAVSGIKRQEKYYTGGSGGLYAPGGAVQSSGGDSADLSTHSSLTVNFIL